MGTRNHHSQPLQIIFCPHYCHYQGNTIKIIPIREKVEINANFKTAVPCILCLLHIVYIVYIVSPLNISRRGNNQINDDDDNPPH